MKQKKIFCHICFFCFVLSFSSAQNSKIDSLIRCIDLTKEDTTKVLLLNDLSKEFRNNDPDTVIILCKQVLAISLKKHYLMGMGRSCHNAGVANYMKGNYAEALVFLNNALAIWKVIYPPEGGITAATTLGNMGLLYSDLGNYPRALEYFFKILQTAETAHEKQIFEKELNKLIKSR